MGDSKEIDPHIRDLKRVAEIHQEFLEEKRRKRREMSIEDRLEKIGITLEDILSRLP